MTLNTRVALTCGLLMTPAAILLTRKALAAARLAVKAMEDEIDDASRGWRFD